MPDNDPAKPPRARPRGSWTDRIPFEAFDARFRTLWLRAAIERFTLEFTTPHELASFRRRAYNYRAVARANPDKCPDWKRLYASKLERSLDGLVALKPGQPGKARFLIFGPPDLSHSAALAQIPGLSPPTASEASATYVDGVDALSDDPLAAFAEKP